MCLWPQCCLNVATILTQQCVKNVVFMNIFLWTIIWQNVVKVVSILVCTHQYIFLILNFTNQWLRTKFKMCNLKLYLCVLICLFCFVCKKNPFLPLTLYYVSCKKNWWFVVCSCVCVVACVYFMFVLSKHTPFKFNTSKKETNIKIDGKVELILRGFSELQSIWLDCKIKTQECDKEVYITL